MRLKELITKIEQWAIDRELDKKATVEAQSIKTAEEMAELIIGISKDNIEVIKDSIGDVFVTLVIGNMIDEDFNIEKFIKDARRIISVNEDKKSKCKFISDLGESISNIAYWKYGEEEITFALTDIIHVSQFYDLDFTGCIESAYNEIKDRKGKTVNGQFIKEEDL